jgi:hypothetical protein
MSIDGFKLDEFTSIFRQKGGARSYLFMYMPFFPLDILDTGLDALELKQQGNLTKEQRDLLRTMSLMSFHVRATTMPESTIEELILNWQGSDFKVGGKRTYSDWTITFNVDSKYEIREDFEEWLDLISKFKDFRNDYGKMDKYMEHQTLYLLNGKGEKVSTVTLIDAWPKSVGPVTLDYSNMDIAQFDVTFSYQYHKITK